MSSITLTYSIRSGDRVLDQGTATVAGSVGKVLVLVQWLVRRASFEDVPTHHFQNVVPARKPKELVAEFLL